MTTTKDDRRVAVVGVGYSPVARRQEALAGSLALTACRAAIADAGLDVSQIDGISTYSQPSRPLTDTAMDGVDVVGADYLTLALGLNELNWACTVDRGTVTAAVIEAVHALAAGECEYVLVWRAMHNPAGQFGRMRRDYVEGDAQFTAPWGFGHNVVYSAVPYARYLAKYGATREDMATFIVRNRANAADNPNAVFFGAPLTREEYLNAKMIAEPLSILDCDMPVDGCGALVLTTADRARDLRHPPAYVAGGANLGLPRSKTLMTSLEQAKAIAAELARALWHNTGRRVEDITAAQLYDGFSWFVYIWSEAFGLFPEGEAFRALQDESTARNGSLPLNTGGGALGMGRLHGTPQLIEGVLQVQGRAGSRQIADASTMLVCTGAPLRGSAAVVLTA